MNGRLRENVVHFKTVAEAAQAMAEGKVAAVLAQRAELEEAIKGQEGIVLDGTKFAELKIDSWPLEDLALAEALAAAMADLKRDGTIAAIFKSHGISYLAS